MHDEFMEHFKGKIRDDVSQAMFSEIVKADDEADSIANLHFHKFINDELLAKPAELHNILGHIKLKKMTIQLPS